MNAVVTFVTLHKKLLIILGVVVILVIGRQIALQPPKNELTYTVRSESLVDTVQTSGTFEVAQQIQVNSPTKGILTEVYVSNDEQVKKGAALFHVESTATEAEKLKAASDYQEAVSGLKTAQQAQKALDAAMWTQQQSLLDAKDAQKYKNENTTNPATGNGYTDLEKLSIDAAVTQAQKNFGSAEEKYKEVGVAISAAQSKVALTKRAYDETRNATVVAPAAGKVVNLRKRVSDQVGTAPVLMLVDFANPVVTVSINEAYIPRIALGQKVAIVFDALKTKTFVGSVETLDTIGTEVDGVVTYTGRIAVPDIGPEIRPNMTALVTIETVRKEGVLTVPNSALIERNGKTYVRKANMGNETLIEVSVGIKGVTKTEIVNGLFEGNVIAANGASGIADARVE